MNKGDEPAPDEIVAILVGHKIYLLPKWEMDEFIKEKFSGVPEEIAITHYSAELYGEFPEHIVKAWLEAGGENPADLIGMLRANKQPSN